MQILTAPIQTYWIRNSASGAQQSEFQQSIEVILMPTDV